MFYCSINSLRSKVLAEKSQCLLAQINRTLTRSPKLLALDSVLPYKQGWHWRHITLKKYLSLSTLRYKIDKMLFMFCLTEKLCSLSMKIKNFILNWPRHKDKQSTDSKTLFFQTLKKKFLQKVFNKRIIFLLLCN